MTGCTALKDKPYFHKTWIGQLAISRYNKTINKINNTVYEKNFAPGIHVYCLSVCK